MKMSLKELLCQFYEFGLKRSDAKVYIFLAKKGPHKCKDICEIMNIAKQQLYLSLRNLQKMGIVHVISKHPAIFAALPLERVLDIFADIKIKDAENTKQNKQEILRVWQSIMKGD
jgi:sugar-specific transcriptional regulator TrmB